MNHTGPRLSKAARKRIADYRKETLTASEHVYGDLAATAEISYSMAYKYMNAERTSIECDRAFTKLTGKSPLPTEAWVPRSRSTTAGARTPTVV